MRRFRLFSNVGEVEYCLCAFRPASQIDNQVRFVYTSRLYNLNKKITFLVRNSRLEDARALFDSTTDKNNVTWNSMLSGYVRGREIVKARKLFDEMPQRDLVSWNIMISGYILWEEVFGGE